MRFSLIALFLLSLIVAFASGFKWSVPRIPKFPKFKPNNLPASSELSDNSYSGNVQNIKPKTGLEVDPFARLPRHRDSSTAKPYYSANRGSGGTHSYPASSGLSGNSYSGNVQNLKPKTGLGVNPFARLPRYRGSSTAKPYYSANRGSGGTHSYPDRHQQQSPRTEVHHHYHYNPPHRIKYGLTYHPVYQGQPPVYVYKYRNSGSRFDNLLTGLALYNLGRNSNSHHYNSDKLYTSSPGEICKLRITKGLDDFEETRIDCNLISSFIWDDTTSTLNEQPTSNTVEDALNVKGPSIQVTPGMTCSIIRTFSDTTTTRRSVDCELLQEYARTMFDEGLPITQSTSYPEVDSFSSNAKVHHDDQHSLVLKNGSTHYNSGVLGERIDYKASKHHNVDLHDHVLKNASNNLSNLFLQESAQSLSKRRKERIQILQSTSNPEFVFPFPIRDFVNSSRSKVHHHVDQRHQLHLKNSSKVKHQRKHLHDIVLSDTAKNHHKKIIEKNYVFRKNAKNDNYKDQNDNAMKNDSGCDAFCRLSQHNAKRRSKQKNSFYPGNKDQNKNPKSYMSINNALVEIRRIAEMFSSSSSQQSYDAKSGLNSSNGFLSEVANNGSTDDAIRRSPGLPQNLDQHSTKSGSNSDNLLQNENAMSGLADDVIRRSAGLPQNLNQHSTKSGSNSDNLLLNENAMSGLADDVIRRSAGLPQNLNQRSTKSGSNSDNLLLNENAKSDSVGDAIRRLSERYSFFGTES